MKNRNHDSTVEVKKDIESLNDLARESEKINLDAIRPDQRSAISRPAIPEHIKKEYIDRLIRNPKVCPHCGGSNLLKKYYAYIRECRSCGCIWKPGAKLPFGTPIWLACNTIVLLILCMFYKTKEICILYGICIFMPQYIIVCIINIVKYNIINDMRDDSIGSIASNRVGYRMYTPMFILLPIFGYYYELKKACGKEGETRIIAEGDMMRPEKGSGG